MTKVEAQQQGAVIEAVLFTVGKSVETSLLTATLECTVAEAEAATERLAVRYAKTDCGVQLFHLKNAWQLGTRREFCDALIRVAKGPQRQVPNQVVFETLAIVVYRQPVTKIEVAKVRGVSSDHTVNKLIEYGFIHKAGRLDAPGRPASFATMGEFFRCFGVDSEQDLSSATSDQEAKIQEEVKRGLNYHFGTKKGRFGEDSEDGD